MPPGQKHPLFCRKKSRGQSLTEFMILLSIMVLYILAFSVIYGGQQSNQFYFLESLLGKTVGESVALSASAAYIAGNGSSTDVRIGTVQGDISVSGHSVLVTLEDRVVHSPIVCSAVSGNFSSGLKAARNSYGNITVG
jgi:hypothetical protein